MTTPRKTNQRTPPAKRKDVPPLRSDVVAAIQRAWPGGVVEMPFGSEESWFWDVHPKLVTAFQRLKGVRLLHGSGAEEMPRWRDTDEEDFLHDSDLSHSYQLFFVVPEGDAFTFETQLETNRSRSLKKCGSGRNAAAIRKRSPRRGGDIPVGRW